MPGLVQILSERLEPTDLQSLLLEVQARRAGAITPKRLLEQYETNRFVRPSRIEPGQLLELDRLAWQLLPPEYEPLELSPVCPLGTNSVVATVHQDKAISTTRNTEVVSDSTNVMALEAAVRRRALRQSAERKHERVLLAASHRLIRGQHYQVAGLSSHFRVFSMAAAGRSRGNLAFETAQLIEQISFYLRLIGELRQLGLELSDLRVGVTDITLGGLTETLEEQLLQPLRHAHPDSQCYLDPDRTSGHGYYDRVCFKIYASNPAGEAVELVDGGPTNWTRQLLSDEKESLVVSGLGTERLVRRLR